jgi:hypothetical protein
VCIPLFRQCCRSLVRRLQALLRYRNTSFRLDRWCTLRCPLASMSQEHNHLRLCLWRHRMIGRPDKARTQSPRLKAAYTSCLRMPLDWRRPYCTSVLQDMLCMMPLPPGYIPQRRILSKFFALSMTCQLDTLSKMRPRRLNIDLPRTECKKKLLLARNNRHCTPCSCSQSLLR